MADTPRVVRPKVAAARQAASNEIAGRAAVQTDYRKGKQTLQETARHERLEEGHFPPGVEPALIRVGIGNTINLGNYESMRIDISVTLPCRVEDLEEGYRRASEYASEFMAEEEAVWLGPANTAPAKTTKR